MRAFTHVMTFIGGVAFALLAVLVLMFFSTTDSVGGVPELQERSAVALPTHLGLASFMMTAVTVVLACVAVGISVVAVYSFREIRERAERTASEAANRAIDEQLSDEAIQARVDAIALGRQSDIGLAELEDDLYPNNDDER